MRLLLLPLVVILLLSLPILFLILFLYACILILIGKLPKPLNLEGVIPNNYLADVSDDETRVGDIYGCFTTTGGFITDFEVVEIWEIKEGDLSYDMREVGSGRTDTEVLMERWPKGESIVFRKKIL